MAFCLPCLTLYGWALQALIRGYMAFKSYGWLSSAGSEGWLGINSGGGGLGFETPDLRFASDGKVAPTIGTAGTFSRA